MSQSPHLSFGFVGAGNMTQSMIAAWTSSRTVLPEQIFATNRTPGKLKKICDQFGIQALANNEELIEKCDVIILAVKPQDLIPALEPISSAFGAEKVVLSLPAGVNLARLRRLMPNVQKIIRVMPNTPASIRAGVTGYYLPAQAEVAASMMESLFRPLGLVVRVDSEDDFSTLAVACSAGVGFVLELMTYWQEWLEEHGYAAELAREMVVQTFLGSAQLAQEHEHSPLADLQARVTSKKGITSAGLQSMRELEIERALRYSFEKSALRDREIGEEQGRL